MDAAFRYLKWNDDVVGLVVPDLSVLASGENSHLKSN